MASNCVGAECLGGGLFFAGVFQLASALTTNDDFLGFAMYAKDSRFNFTDANFVILDGDIENGRAKLESRQ